VVVVAVVHGQFAQALAGEFTGAAATDVRVHFQRFIAVTHLTVALGVGQDAVQLGGVGGWIYRAHGVTCVLFSNGASLALCRAISL
jgi:hypothetical protein